MAACPACGKKNPDGFQFCGFCGAPLAGESREERKTVTVLFCDVTGSTALGESTDPEALRALLARYFERMKGIVESHGGTVEKFIGDAVMAVFGIPTAHEDDALRACKAAVDMREALPELGVQARIGVNTGEVVTGTEERLATGDAVNVAARLEQAAQPGDVLLGGETLRLVDGAVEAESVEPLELKGKREPVAAFRLLRVNDAPERLHGVVFVGRERELDEIAGAWVRAGTERRCELVTVVAEAGVGKTRLAAEALGGLGARVVRGRCLSYGDGITYWPVVEVVKQLAERPSDPGAAAAIRSLLGESAVGTSSEEIAWAFRKLLEEQAPLVCLFEDIHWGEETFLDLVEHVALLSAGSQMLLLCTARPELLERRPSWPVTFRLAPLEHADADRLVPVSLPAGVREQIARASGGNPLFLTEMAAMANSADENVTVPPNLRALLTARLDQVDPAERRVLERGAVEGEMFHRGAVQALAPDEPQVTARLAALVRRELVRPDRAQIPGEDGFRFRHLLIRDATYDALPKSVRADLHVQFAEWLQENGRGLVEVDEILGYHLEQAAHYRAELGRSDPEVAQRAGVRLAAAGRRALDREDVRAAAGLLERALWLTRPLHVDVHAELDLAHAVMQEPARASQIAEEAAGRAANARDETGAALAHAMALHYRLMTTAGSVDELDALLLDARRRLEEEDDHAGLAQAWWALGFGVANRRGRHDDWATASLEAYRHNRLAGRLGAPTPDLGISLIIGSRPADEALEVVDRLLADTQSAWLLLSRAWLLAMLDPSNEDAQLIAQHADARLREHGDIRWGEWILAEISGLAGDYEDESNRLRILCDWLEAQEQFGFLEIYLARLGRSLCLLGRFDEAEHVVTRARALQQQSGPASDTNYTWRAVLARIRANQGEVAEAERLARDTVEECERTDALDFQSIALWDLADVLAAAGRPDDAAATLGQALDRCRLKKNRALETQIRRRLDALQDELSAPSPTPTP